MNFVKSAVLDPGRGRFRVIQKGRRRLTGSGMADKGDDKYEKLITIVWGKSEDKEVYNWRVGEPY